MAEIRKHDPAVGNAIAQALQAAMGEPVRPNQPGGRPAPAADVAASQPTTDTTTWISFTVTKSDAE